MTNPFGNGKKQEVIITPIPRQFHPEQVYQSMFGTAVSPAHWDEVDKLQIWADSGRRAIIAAVRGVLQVEVDDLGVKYIVTLDPRYDTAWVMEEIRAQLLIKQPRTRKKPEYTHTFTFRLEGLEGMTIGPNAIQTDPKPKAKRKKASK